MDRSAANWNKTGHDEESKRYYCKFIVLPIQPKQPPNYLCHRGAKFYPRRLNLSGEQVRHRYKLGLLTVSVSGRT
jgi:hypothetical protein